MKIIFFGSPDLSVPFLEALKVDPAFDLLAVVTQPDKPSGRGGEMASPPVKVAADRLGIPVLQFPSLKKDPTAIDQLIIDDTSANPLAEMGPVIDAAARDRICQVIDEGQRAGARLVRGSTRAIRDRGFFVPPALFELAHPEMLVAREEIFGPVLTMLHPSDLEEAVPVRRAALRISFRQARSACQMCMPSIN